MERYHPTTQSSWVITLNDAIECMWTKKQREKQGETRDMKGQDMGQGEMTAQGQGQLYNLPSNQWITEEEQGAGAAHSIY